MDPLRDRETQSARVPRVGLISAWFDPEIPAMWSGVPRGILDELRRLGIFGAKLDATAWPPLARLIHRWARNSARSDSWNLRPLTRSLNRVTERVLLAKRRPDVDGWIHLVGANGPVVREKYVTLYEMSPSQLYDAAKRSWASSFGYPNASIEQMRWVTRRQEVLYRNAHACCVASRWAADSLVRDHGIDPKRIRVVGYGRNKEMPPPKSRDWSTPRFLFIGRDWNRKNGDAVVRAFVKLRSEVPDARLDVVGGPESPLQVDGVAEHRVEGFEPEGRAHIEALFRAATCFVVPSLIEPFGIVYVEAATAGLPSIATSVGGTVDSVGPGGILVDPHDDEEIYRAMRALAEPDTARELGAIALERSSLFTWPLVGQRIVRSLDLGPIPGVELADFV